MDSFGGQMAQMTVKKLKEMVALPDIYELNPGARYLVKVRRDIWMVELAQIKEALDATGLKFLVVVGDHVEFYEIGE